MHEMSLLSDLMRKIDKVVHEHHAQRATHVTVKLGALSHISPSHFREHFDQAKIGTVAEEADLEVVALTDEQDEHAQEIYLESLEVS